MKIAVCFWGLTRSLKYTINSLHENIFDVFKKNNIEYKIFMHTYNVYGKYNNKRSLEHNITLDNNEYKLLEPDYISIDNQEEIKSNINFLKYRTHKDPWDSQYQTHDNFILAMYSKKCLLKLFQDNDDGTYTHFLMIRSDVRYLNNFDIRWLSDIKNNEIYVPIFHFKPFNFNDRMALTNDKRVFTIYNNIYDIMLEYSKKKPLHSETINKVNMDNNNINVIPIKFFFNRVRANGIEGKDVSFINGKFTYK